MTVLIGLGKAGCDIVNRFSDNYKKITIDAGSELPEFNSPEDYDQKLTDYAHLLDFEEPECYFFVCGAGKVSAASLRLLELIQSKTINLVYIYPEEVMLSPTQKKLNRIAFNVFQQYARSGLLNSMYIMSNEEICSFLPYYSIEDMYDNINEAIVNVFENVIFYLNEKPMLGSHHEAKDVSRIRTVEYGDFNENKKNVYFPLDNVTETCYINIVSNEDMKNNRELLDLLKGMIKENTENNILSSFVVFRSDYEHSFYYAIRFTHYLQEK
tara:strand:- start:8707 stop:9513 length:807 start_codon:yes stop_codon:yes gene_type:complete